MSIHSISVGSKVCTLLGGPKPVPVHRPLRAALLRRPHTPRALDWAQVAELVGVDEASVDFADTVGRLP